MPLQLSCDKNVFKGFSFAIRQNGWRLEDVSQLRLVLYQVPFFHCYFFQVWQRRMVLRAYIGQCFFRLTAPPSPPPQALLTSVTPSPSLNVMFTICSIFFFIQKILEEQSQSRIFLVVVIRCIKRKFPVNSSKSLYKERTAVCVAKYIIKF